MFDSLFDLPLVVVGIAILILLCVFALSGLAIFSRHILPRLKLGPEESVFTSAMMQAVMVFYGLAVALIAVSVWQTHTDAAQTTSREATALGVLYREVSGYPEPVRSQLQQLLREYVDYVIHEAWPQQRQGQVPSGGVGKIDDFEAKLVTFEPATEGQKILHGETLRAYGQMIEARRLRLDAAGRGCPIAENSGRCAGNLHRPDHFHHLRPGPSISRRPRSSTRSISTHLRPTDETLNLFSLRRES